MSGPPPPPKRKNHKAIATYGVASQIPVAVGSGRNVVKAIQENNSYQAKVDQQTRLDNQTRQDANNRAKEDRQTKIDHQAELDRRENQMYADRQAKLDNQARQAKIDSNRPPKKKQYNICQISAEPDAIIGAGVEIHGDFQFDKLLRVDGKFQGNLFSLNKGDIIVGKHGCIIGEVIVARRMIVEGGHLVGKVVVDELLLLDRATIKGDVTCKLIQIEGPDVTITGRANIHPLAPELIDEFDNIITEVPKKFKKPKKEIYKSPTKASIKLQAASTDLNDSPESPQDSVQTAGSGVKAAAVQTNASAKPPNSKNNNLSEEENLALEKAQQERNAAKERHKQAKLAKKGENPEEVVEPKLLPVSPPKPSAATAPLPKNPSTESIKENKIQPQPPKEPKPKPEEKKKEPEKEPQKEPEKEKPAKSPTKLLPPSEEQRKKQLENDLKTSGGEKDAKSNESDYEAPPDLRSELEREAAATHVQRIARGRRARSSKNANVAPKLGADDKPHSASDLMNLSAEELEKQQAAAVHVQKMARGKAARTIVTKKLDAIKLGEEVRARVAAAAQPDASDDADAADAPAEDGTNTHAPKSSDNNTAPVPAHKTALETTPTSAPTVESPASNEPITNQPGGVGYTEALLG